MGATTYFFDAYDGEALFVDSEGSNCSTAAEMRREASRILMELVADNICSDDRQRKLTIVARSALSGSTTMTLTYTSDEGRALATN